jgi:uncharacterized protein (UPF0261 family)
LSSLFDKKYGYLEQFMAKKIILVVGTYDTKNDELSYISKKIIDLGGDVLTMDVSVLGNPAEPTDISKQKVAEASGLTIDDAKNAGDENKAMQIMAKGSSLLALQLYNDNKFDGVIILGGTMGTDLALDVCAALPLGVPKYIVSTVSFSPLIPAARLAPDIQMILWAGGLYGLNSICEASLSQAAGAVLGAANAFEIKKEKKPCVGMTSLGSSALKYMKTLKPALEARGYEVAIFHSTGMGGRAFEGLCEQGAFVAVMDFCIQELTNHIHGSEVTSGADRVTAAGKHGIPQICAPGCHDLVDLICWQEMPDKWRNHPYHAHNRLISSIVLNPEERVQVAKGFMQQLSMASSETHVILPLGGCGEWDRPDGGLNDPVGLETFMQTCKENQPSNVISHELNCHINDLDFSNKALEIFDDMVERRIVVKDFNK